MTSRTIAVFLSTLAVSAYVSAPVQAQDAAPHSVRVRYTDLDLSTETGAKILYARLSTAAHTVCESDADLRNLAQALLVKKCYDHTLAHSVDLISRPRLTAVHRHTVGPQITG